MICGSVTVLPDCDGRSRVDVRRVATFSEAAMRGKIRDGEFQTDDFGFDMGAGGEIVVVRIFYEWPTRFSGEFYFVPRVGAVIKMA